MITLIIIFISSAFIWFFPAIFATIAQYSFRSIKTNEKLIALTFDDGPNLPYTESLLDVLSHHNVQATFFVVGKNLEKFPHISNMIIKSGHVLGNHSYSHKFTKYLQTPSFESEILKTQEIIESQTGKIPTLYRSPWLFQSPWLMKTVKKHTLTFVSGVFGSQREIRGRSGEKIAEDALKISKPGAILIFHDGYDAKGADRSQTVKAIDILIPELKKQGYELVTVDILLGVNPYKII